jgi:hypothetical protein
MDQVQWIRRPGRHLAHAFREGAGRSLCAKEVKPSWTPIKFANELRCKECLRRTGAPT